MEQAPLPGNSEIAILSIGKFIIVAAFLGAVMALLLSRSSQQSRLKLSLAMLAGSLAIAVVLLHSVRTHQYGTSTLPAPPRAPVGLKPGSPMKVVEPESFFSATSPQVEVDDKAVNTTASLPEWTQQTRRVDGKRKLVVVKSGRFAAREEAESAAFDEAIAAAVQHFHDLDPRGIGDRFVTQLDAVRQSVQKRFEEITEHDFGKFKASMYQVWLEIELTPQLGEQIAQPWREAAVEARLRTLGYWGIGITAVAALLAFALRLDSAWRGRQRAASSS